MIIENSEALKTWLTSCLGRLCDADPAALAKYVMALVKKDKPENELKEFCLDQLDVFLLKETKPFVELLFQTLKTKAYLLNSVNLPVSNVISASTTSVSTASVNSTSHNTIIYNVAQIKPPPMPVVSQPTVETYSPLPVLSKSENETKFEDFAIQSGEQQVPGSRSRSRSPVITRFRSHSRESDGNHLIRRRSEDEKRHKFFSNRQSNRSRHYRFRQGHTDRERDRNNRDKERRVNHNCPERQRSRSRSGSYECNRSPSSSGSSDYSRSRTRSKERPKDHTSRSDSKNSRKQIDGPELTCDHGDTDYRLNSIPRATDLNKINISRRTRCQDYNERGYCMRGDQCPFDHGNDVLVVDDYSALNLHGPSSAQAHKSSNAISNSSVLPKPPGVESPIPPLPPSSPPPPPPPPPPLPPLPPPPSSSYAPEPYNPETPALYRPKGDHLLFYSDTCPPPLPPPGQPCPPGQPPIIPPLLGGVPLFNPNEPPPPFRNLVERPRELIGVPTLATDSATACESDRIMDSDQTVSQKVQPSTTQVTNTNSSVRSGHGDNSFMKRKSFDYNWPRKTAKKSSPHGDRCILELRKIPKHLNTANNLINHFSQFGSITNVLTNIDNDPEAALVYFANHSEAVAAYRHKEAVLHNRFIKLFWHNKDSLSNNSSVIENSIVSTSNVTNNSLCDSDNAHNQPKKKSDNGTDVTSTTPITVSETKPTNSEFTIDKGPLSTKQRSPTKPVFNPAALKKTNVLNATKKAKEDQKTDALKKKIDLYKKKQAILESYLSNQKVLLEKLTVCKNDKEKDIVKMTIEDIRKNTAELQADLKRDTDEIMKLTKLCNSNEIEKKEAEKELLDAEMDLYNKQHRGDDVSDLISKVVELKQQTLHIVSGIGRGRPPQRPRRGLMSKYRARIKTPMLPSTRSVDHRPKKLLISNASDIDKASLTNHFLQFGNIENIDVIDNGGVVVSFKTRKDAEIAISLGSKFGDLILLMSWYHDNSMSEQPKQENFNFTGSLTCPYEEDEEEEEEEEEEDSEARSWRR